MTVQACLRNACLFEILIVCHHQDELQGLLHGVQTALQDPRSP